VPTLILHGRNDEVCPYPLAVAQQEGIRDSKLVPLDECGHFLFYDQMERFNRELAAFTKD
jgi:non-heme chloroperoxidase